MSRRSAPTAASTATSQAAPARRQQTRYLAVLPFRVLGDPQQLRYVGDGVVEALSSRLFQLSGVTVVSSRDAEQARGAASIAEAARSLGANLIVEGTVQAAGDSLRLVVNLHDIATGRRTWSRQFTGTRETLFTLQDDIYDGLVGALGASPRPEALAHSADRPTDDIEAYDLYLKGRDALRSGQDLQQLEAAIDFFEQAVRKDSGFALAHAGIADASLTDVQREEGQLLGGARARRRRCAPASSTTSCRKCITRSARSTPRAAGTRKRSSCCDARWSWRRTRTRPIAGSVARTRRSGEEPKRSTR